MVRAERLFEGGHRPLEKPLGIGVTAFMITHYRADVSIASSKITSASTNVSTRRPRTAGQAEADGPN